MDNEGRRRGERAYLEVPIRISGANAMGRTFMEDTQTLVVSPSGAKIVSSQILAPNQELDLVCTENGKDAAVLVVGEINSEGDEHYYGIQLVKPEPDFWGPIFPGHEEASGSFGRALLRCITCSTLELAFLDEIELEVMLAQRHISRYCNRCVDVTQWSQCDAKEAEEAALLAAQASAPHPVTEPVTFESAPRTKLDRRHRRLALRSPVCIRHATKGDDVATTEDISRGGFRFKSSRVYSVGSLIEAALPYTEGGANIFAQARIAYAEELPGKGMNVYGVAYLSQS
jgi:PilZ domain